MKRLLLSIALSVLVVCWGHSQKYMASGSVIGDDGIGLPGVSVIEKGTTNGTVTDINGKYTLNTSSSEALLIFSFIGMQTQEFKAKDAQNITLSSKSHGLDEVVVIGSTLRATKKELGNAVSSVKADDLIKTTPVGVSSALQGKIAGAHITQNSGDPSGGFSIRLRGVSSVAGSSDPLYIIDGVPVNNGSYNVTNLNVPSTNISLGQNRLADINPNDIASIEVLNGGAAGAIYGSRAANGVVLITTKKGKSGKPSFSFSTSINVNEIRKKAPIYTGSKQFGGAADNVRLHTISTIGVDTDDPSVTTTTVSVNGGERTLATNIAEVKRYDYQDEIFQTGLGTDNYFSVNGGSEKTSYYGSLSYLYNEGIVKNTDFERITTKVRLTHRFSDWLKAQAGISYSHSSSNEKPDGNVFWSPINSINITNNTYDITQRDADGNLQAVEPTRVNPLSVIETFDITQKVDRVISDLQLNLIPFENFTVDFLLGLDKFKQQGDTYIPVYPYSVNTGYYNDGYISEAENKITQINNDINLGYVFDFSTDYKFKTNAGANFQTFRRDYLSRSARGLTSENTLESATTPLPEGEADEKLDIWGYFLSGTLNVKDFLFLTLSGRLDGSTAFGEDERNHFYPKASISFSPSSMDSWNSSWLDELRIRSSWGASGNLSGIEPYARFINYSDREFNGNTIYNVDPYSGNPDIKPEKNVEIEAGFDANMFNNRVGLVFTWFYSTIEDLLVPRTLASSQTGALSRIANVGELNNRGIELQLRGTPIKTENVKLDLTVNFAKNKNKITKLSQDFIQWANPISPSYLILGESAGSFYGTYFARDDNGELLLTPEGLPQLELGNEETGEALRDASGQPTGNPLKKVLGKPSPDYTVSFGGNLEVKNWRLGFLFDAAQNFEIFDADKRTRQGVGIGDYAEKELNGEIPRGWIWSIYPIEEWRVVDGSYIKMRELSASYTLPKMFKVFENTVFTISGRNLFSIDDFTSYDPETNTGGQSDFIRYNFGTVPIPRVYTFSVKTNF